MPFQRSSGVLLHPTSLPSAHGIGDLGQPAYKFIDFLEQSGQKLWQVLPLGPTGYEHSPYIMNFSTFAGNPLMISLEQLVRDGWLEADELYPLEPGEGDRPDQVNFGRVIPHKMLFLRKASDRFYRSLAIEPDPSFDQFCQSQAAWLDDFVLFMALLEAHEGKDWNQWDAAVARREPEALQSATNDLKDRIQFHRFLQYQFFEQWQALRRYANTRGIQIIGDISIYVCYNSADVWMNPGMFQLDPETLAPKYIAGVPPDYFSATGQLWGNPVYDWDQLQKTGFQWWLERFRATLEYADIVRIDHFRGFEAYWRVPAGEETAMNGEWVTAPGVEFFETLGDTLGTLPVLAEDLGVITPEVEALRDRFQFPGMRILQFAFGGDANNPYLPHNYVQNSVVYTGTHDNDTTLGWWQSTGDAERHHIALYLGYDHPGQVPEVNWTLIRLALGSTADMAIIPLQDLLGLGHQARMNDPSINAGNWRWRYENSDQLSPAISQRLLHLTQLYNR
jgi:4-alpha-glucanotransferase